MAAPRRGDRSRTAPKPIYNVNALSQQSQPPAPSKGKGREEDVVGSDQEQEQQQSAEESAEESEEEELPPPVKRARKSAGKAPPAKRGKKGEDFGSKSKQQMLVAVASVIERCLACWQATCINALDLSGPCIGCCAWMLV
jgi:hypothetical protein